MSLSKKPKRHRFPVEIISSVVWSYHQIRARQTNYKGIDITIMNYKLFLEKLWAGDIIPAS